MITNLCCSLPVYRCHYLWIIKCTFNLTKMSSFAFTILSVCWMLCTCMSCIWIFFIRCPCPDLSSVTPPAHNSMVTHDTHWSPLLVDHFIITFVTTSHVTMPLITQVKNALLVTLLSTSLTNRLPVHHHTNTPPHHYPLPPSFRIAPPPPPASSSSSFWSSILLVVYLWPAVVSLTRWQWTAEDTGVDERVTADADRRGH